MYSDNGGKACKRQPDWPGRIEMVDMDNIGTTENAVIIIVFTATGAAKAATSESISLQPATVLDCSEIIR